MKHLKKINEFFYKPDCIFDTIDDILLEINDMPNFIGLSWKTHTKGVTMGMEAPDTFPYTLIA